MSCVFSSFLLVENCQVRKSYLDNTLSKFLFHTCLMIFVVSLCLNVKRLYFDYSIDAVSVVDKSSTTRYWP